MAPYHQIRQLKSQNHKLRVKLGYAEGDKISLNAEIHNLKSQLEKYQNQVAENEILLQEKDEMIAEYLEEINQLDHDANSDQVCPNCFEDKKEDMKEALAKGSCSPWMRYNPCGHRICKQCFYSEAFAEENDQADVTNFSFRRTVCGICRERRRSWTPC